MKFNDLVKRARKIEASEGPKVNVAVLGHYATQYFCKCLTSHAKTEDINLNLYEAEFNQINFEVFDTNSELYKHQAEYIVLLYDAKVLAKEFYEKKDAEKVMFAKSFLANLKEIVSVISERTNSKIVLFNLYELISNVYSFLSLKREESISYQLQKINYELSELSQSFDNLYLLNLKGLVSNYGFNNSYNEPIFINTNQPYHIDFIPELTGEITRLIKTFQGKIQKCLILDLDNTLWGGVIGDDGINNIEIGDLGQGKIFTEIQLWAKNLKERGIILCVCSKNNEDIAKEPFEKLNSMVLSLDDIAVFVANWNNKADNIRYIQKVLNIGFDSMVFIDDNPAERDIVKSNIPEVTVPDLPESPEEYMKYITGQNLFATVTTSALDKDRTAQYKAEAKRVKLQSSTNIEDYLKSLNMVGEITLLNDSNIPRIAQLTQRSNQFNLRTIRFSESELQKWNQTETNKGFSISLEDKFGDYGIISTVMTEMHNDKSNEAFISNWLMSCRVLKRNVEDYVINMLVENLSKQGISKIFAEYIPTKKNKMVELHYHNLGFVKQSDNNWMLNIKNYKKRSNYIKNKA